MSSVWRLGGKTSRLSEVRATDQLDNQTEPLVRFLQWLTPLMFGFALLAIGAAGAFRDAASGLLGATLLTYGCALVVARAQARRGQWREAVMLVSSGFLVAPLILAFAQPGLMPVMVFGPLLAVGISLPYTSERILRFLLIGAWLVTVAVVALAELASLANLASQGSGTPAWYGSGFRIAALPAAVAVFLLLLWQFRMRLFGIIAQAREAEERAVYDATHDSLTGLPNRVLFLERLGRAMEHAKRDEGRPFSLLFLGLDRFKNVNDSLGHAVGDLLLVEAARRLEGGVHPADTVGRLGGDEFAVLLGDPGEVEDAICVAERLQKKLSAPFYLSGHELYATASVGVVSRPTRYRQPEDLLRDVHTAMYEAKAGGKSRWEVFAPEMRERAVKLLNLETDLRRAVERGEEFAVLYQPIVSLKSGEVVGFEALVRWEHPRRGLLPPAVFVPLAEETGLIVPIGSFVLREACRRLVHWHARFPNHRPLSVSVNLSVAQLSRSGLAEQVGRTLREAGLDGRHLRLEITESAVMRDPESAIGTLSDLRAAGVRFAVDDFGTGYSSLSVLHRFPVDTLKVDRSFVSSMESRPDNAEIVQTTITLAHGLGMDVVAEGVDSPAQLELLREMGCDYAQGYCFSRPVDASVAQSVIASRPRW